MFKLYGHVLIGTTFFWFCGHFLTLVYSFSKDLLRETSCGGLANFNLAVFSEVLELKLNDETVVNQYVMSLQGM